MKACHSCGTIRQHLTFRSGIFSRIARKNQAFNQQFEVKGLVNGQGLPPVADMRYGAANVRRSGCGLIAVYNALILLGNPQPLGDVIAWGDLKGSRLLGLLGTSPRRTKKLLQKLGYNVKAVRSPKEFAAQARDVPVCLFTFWNQRGSILRGMHTVCLRCNAEGLEVYNLYNSSSHTERIASFEEWRSKGIGPVVLYCISLGEGMKA